MKKQIIIFEGFGSAGKTTLIQKLKNDLEKEFLIEILDNKYPKYASILFNDNTEISLSKSKYVYFCFRWTRLFLFFNYIVNSESNIYFFDRGILTNYIYGKNDEVPDNIINELVDDLLKLINENGIIYKTVFVDCNIEVANFRCNARENVNAERKIKRNQMFEPYLSEINQFSFVKDLFIVNSTESVFKNYKQLIEYIKK